MKCSLFLWLVLALNTVGAKNDNYTFTYNMAMQCKEHISTHGYSYETFYSIDENTLSHTRVNKDNKSVTYLEMHIAILAASNGHILLSTSPFPGKHDSVYEIVVGGGGNKFTELRLNLKRNARSSTKTPKVLSTVDFTAFYIKISNDGLIEFGREGDNLPLISYYDVHTLPINYFSFASWTGVEAKFLYDCPAPGDSDAILPNSQAVEPKMSTSDQLKRSLLMSRLPSVPPADIVPVKLGCKVTYLRYDPLDYKLVTRVAVVMSWTDENLAWDPTKFQGTTELKFRQGQIWRPRFFVYNSDRVGPFETKNPSLISVVHSGEATFHFQTEVKTYCHNMDYVNSWPRDYYECYFVVEPWEVHEKIKIEIINTTDAKMKVFEDIDTVVSNQWKVIYNDLMVISSSIWNEVKTASLNGDEGSLAVNNHSDRFAISLYMARKPQLYHIVFYTPLLVLVSFIMLSFWSEPLEESRIMLYAGCCIIICIWLSFLDFLVPYNVVSTILKLYQLVLDGVLIALLIHVLMLTSVAEKISKTNAVKVFLSSWFIRTVFFLPTVKAFKTHQGYSRQDDDEDAEPFASGSKVEEMESEDSVPYAERKELAEVLDKIMFIVFLITFICIMTADDFLKVA